MVRQTNNGTNNQAAVAAAPVTNWWVYMIRCDDGSLYTGISTDPERRFREHLQHPRGAKYFNGRKPVSMVYTEGGHTRSSAGRREYEIRKLGRRGKLALIESGAGKPGLLAISLGI